MPRLSAWSIRAALVYLALGFTLGSLMLFNKGFQVSPFLLPALLPAHIEIMLFGWTVQLVMGMAFWILPRFPSPPIRGNEATAWAAFILVNLGIWILVTASLLPGGGWLSLAGRLAEAGGILAFALHAWPRVKGFGK